MKIEIIRTLRTASSERFVLRREGQDFAALDLHYLASGSVDGTLVLFGTSAPPQEEISHVLQYIDETLLPSVSFEEKNLAFTVVVGQVLGAFSASEPD